MLQIHSTVLKKTAAIAYSSVGCNVGVGVGVAMGVMVGVANVAVRESGVATKRKQRNMVKMYFHWFTRVRLTCTAYAVCVKN